MSPRATAIAIGLVLFLGLFVAPELGLLASSRKLADACPAAETPSPPDPGFYGAVATLDSLAVLPWVAGRASARATHAGRACLEAFTAGCDVLRDDAVDLAGQAVRERILGEGSGHGTDAATDWRAHVDADAAAGFCAAWSDWRGWLDAQGLDSRSACTLCDPSP